MLIHMGLKGVRLKRVVHDVYYGGVSTSYTNDYFTL